MGKTIQFRCPKCRKRLFKWEEGAFTIDDDCGFKRKKVKDALYVECPKCKTISEMAKFELKAVEVGT